MVDWIPKTLTEIFAETDNVSYGPFKLVKKPGDDYKHAQFYVNDIPVKISPAQNKIMALLITQYGANLTISMLAARMDTPKFAAIFAEMQMTDNEPKVKKAIFDAENAFSAHMSQIKRAITNAVPDEGQRTTALDALSSITRQGGSNKKIQLEFGYRIQLEP